MKFATQAKNAFLSQGNECFSLVNQAPGSSEEKPYVCYYPNAAKCSVPFALTQDGIQVPIPGETLSAKILPYEDLTKLLQAGDVIAAALGHRPEAREVCLN